MKNIAFYLPQFHRIPENDRWWGEGYTEWTAVKKAKPSFEGHNQPRIPLNDNYYDLLDKETMVFQCELMKKYGIDGMCFYHYYFKDGKLLLEKPAENLLEWTDIDMPFCFAWDNISWVRSWSIKSGNAWNLLDELENRSNDNGVLVELDYGDKKQWEQHFYYLLPFFKDERYIKKDGHPIFIFFNSDNIPCFSEMKRCWDELAEKENIKNVFCITRDCENAEQFDFMFRQEPHATIDRSFHDVVKASRNVPNVYDYCDVWESLLKNAYSEKAFLGAFVGYDDTPRRAERGFVIKGQSPELFYEYMLRLFVNAERCNSEFIFINAWNEWGEGMYLEPDKQNGFAYLEAFREAKDEFNKHKHLYMSLAENNYVLVDDSSEKVDRYKNYYTFYKKWLDIKQKSISLDDYFIKQNIKQIAIYGLGSVGKRVYEELHGNAVSIKYGIDANAISYINWDIPVYHPSEELPSVDIIVVALGNECENLVLEMKSKTDNIVKSLNTIFDEMLLMTDEQVE